MGPCYFSEHQMNERCITVNNNMTNRLVQQWVPVTDARGARRLESRWVCLDDLSAASFLPRTARTEQTAHAA